MKHQKDLDESRSTFRRNNLLPHSFECSFELRTRSRRKYRGRSVNEHVWRKFTLPETSSSGRAVLVESVSICCHRVDLCAGNKGSMLCNYKTQGSCNKVWMARSRRYPSRFFASEHLLDSIFRDLRYFRTFAPFQTKKKQK